MTIKDLYNTCENITVDTNVQLYKRSESKKYYSYDFDNVSIQKCSMSELMGFAANTKISAFWVNEVKDRFISFMTILMEGNETEGGLL